MAAETKEEDCSSPAAHIIVISEQANPRSLEEHPLRQISQSPGHLLLLKLWHRDQHLFALRMCRIETKMEYFNQQIFQLCSFFFLFHALSLTLLFTPSFHPNLCTKWWLPALSTASTSAVFAILVQLKLWLYWKASGQLQRERNENRALMRCVQELRMKGSSFDLSKQPHTGKRMKSSSVEINWGLLSFCSRYFITISLLCFSALVFAASKFILCTF